MLASFGGLGIVNVPSTFGYPRRACMTDDELLEDLRRRAMLAPAVRPPAAPAEIALAESRLGFALPSLLRRIYEEGADGGFGPAHGLFPLRSDWVHADEAESLVEVRDKLALGPPHLLPICDWGCASWSCLDCRTEDGAIVTLCGEHPLADTGHDLRSWLQAWLAGADLEKEMFEPGPKRMMVNPFTKKPMEIEGQGKPRGRPWR